MKVVIGVPTLTRPYDKCLNSIERAIPALDAAGYEHGLAFEVGCPYISAARSKLIQKAERSGYDRLVFIDHDISFEPEDLIRLLSFHDDDVVAGTYRFKIDEERYMGTVFSDENGFPVRREDGCLHAELVPAGFLNISQEVPRIFLYNHYDLMLRYTDSDGNNKESVELFNHGAYHGAYWGEDYAFSRRWNNMGRDIWIVPDLNLTHSTLEKDYVGNFHKFLMKQPGGLHDTE